MNFERAVTTTLVVFAWKNSYTRSRSCSFLVDTGITNAVSNNGEFRAASHIKPAMPRHAMLHLSPLELCTKSFGRTSADAVSRFRIVVHKSCPMCKQEVPAPNRSVRTPSCVSCARLHLAVQPPFIYPVAAALNCVTRPINRHNDNGYSAIEIFNCKE